MSDTNPVIADLELVNNMGNSDNLESRNIAADIASAIDTILSEEKFRQKTNITSENEDGLICIDVLQAHFNLCFKKDIPSLTALADSKREHAVSIGGYRSQQIVEIFKSMQTNIISSDSPLSSRLMGNR